jgi:hypothetical protein
MASAIIGGIATRYEVVGSGPPILMYEDNVPARVIDFIGKVKA